MRRWPRYILSVFLEPWLQKKESEEESGTRRCRRRLFGKRAESERVSITIIICWYFSLFFFFSSSLFTLASYFSFQALV